MVFNSLKIGIEPSDRILQKFLTSKESAFIREYFLVVICVGSVSAATLISFQAILIAYNYPLCNYYSG